MRVLIFLCGVLILGGCDTETARTTDRDNTAINQRDADGVPKTPFDQSNDQSDIDLVAKLRAQVLEIDDLSVNGRNIKIITNHGKVVLRGPVDSAAERDSIATVVNDIAGDTNVTNSLEVENN